MKALLIGLDNGVQFDEVADVTVLVVVKPERSKLVPLAQDADPTATTKVRRFRKCGHAGSYAVYEEMG